MKSELQKLLDSNIPADAVEEREAFRNGPKLSYLSGAYVINRLNEVLGQGNWGYTLKALNKVYEGVTQQSSGDVFTTSYIATVGFWALIDGKGASFDEVGYGDGTDKKSPGKAHELATKEALTDGIKRAAKNLGISMGLGLYFKSGEYVDEERTEKLVIPAVKSVKIEKPGELIKPSVETKKDLGVQEKSALEKSIKIQRQSIKSHFSILQAKGVISTDLFKERYLGGKMLDELPDEEVLKTLTKVRTDFKKQLCL